MRRPVTTGRISSGVPVSEPPKGARQSSNTPLSSRAETQPALCDPASYWVGRCVANYSDGRKCVNRAVKDRERCLGHLRGTDAT